MSLDKSIKSGKERRVTWENFSSLTSKGKCHCEICGFNLKYKNAHQNPETSEDQFHEDYSDWMNHYRGDDFMQYGDDGFKRFNKSVKDGIFNKKDENDLYILWEIDYSKSDER